MGKNRRRMGRKEAARARDRAAAVPFAPDAAPAQFPSTGDIVSSPARAWVTLWACILIGLLTMAAFSPVRDNGFIKLDDDAYIYANQRVASGLSRENLAWAFTSAWAGNWHPLTWISHMVDVRLWGLNPAGHHVTSALIHTLTAILLFLVLRGMTGNLWPSLAVALLFSLHPLRVESVAWASERKDVLSGFFWVVAMGAYGRYARRPSVARFVPIPLAMGLGLASKPMLVTLPVVLLVLDGWPLRRLGAGGKGANSPSIPALLLEKAPLALLAAASAAATWVVQSRWGYVKSFEGYPLGVRLGNSLVSYVSYLRKALWPSDLAVPYPFEMPLPLWKPAAALALLTATTVLVVRARRTSPWFLAGWLWYLVTLVPVIGLVQVSDQAMADRYTYLPLIGPAVALVWGVRDLALRLGSGRAIPAAAVAAMVLALVPLTRAQVAAWRDDESLFLQAVKVDSSNWMAASNLGGALIDRGKFDEARPVLEEAIRLNPRYAPSHQNLGVLLAKRLRYAEAIESYREAVRLWPGYADAWNNLGLALGALDRDAEALAAFGRAVSLQPGSAGFRANLGTALFRTGKTNEARSQFAEALRLDPANAIARGNLAIMRGAGGAAGRFVPAAP